MSFLLRFLFAFIAGALVVSAAAEISPRSVESFDRQWRFLEADAPAAKDAVFDDSSWQQVDVPHDWSILGDIREDHPTGKAGGFLPAGIGWYRKKFTLPGNAADRRVFIEFDGVMANSDVWINGHLLGHRPFGYVSFRYELTGHLHFGPEKTNVIAVRADNADQPASRWYAGAGIYRHVRLVTTDPVHLVPWSVFVTTPKLTADAATVRVQAGIINQSAATARVSVRTSLLDPSGKTITTQETPVQSVAAGAGAAFAIETTIAQPQRWDLASPSLYRAVVEVVSAASGHPLDRETSTFGIREFRFEADTGFWINGRNIKILGAALHQDGGAVGVAVPLSVWERRLLTLRETGVNAIRTAHNPFPPEFLDLCDRLGFLVLDEYFDCWTVAKNPYDYHLYFDQWALTDTRDTVRRDRNHPSIFAYSAGNEIHDTPKPELAKRILGSLIEVYHQEDPTRPVTQGLFRPNVTGDYKNGLADLLDVIGQNYRENEIIAAHNDKPTRKILGTENRLEREAWIYLRDTPAYSGQFLWTGYSYLGESGGWPAFTRPLGLVDRTGIIFPRGYQRQSWWSTKPMVYAARRVDRDPAVVLDPGAPGAAAMRYKQVLYPDWNPASAAPHDENVEVYSNAESVELLLNGKSLGSKSLPADASSRNWTVAYTPGELVAIARTGGAEVARFALRTAGPATQLALINDRPHLSVNHFDDVAFVRVEIRDADGVLVPAAADKITFAIEGPGKIVAVDNADPNSHERFAASERSAFQGRALAIVRATGPGKITVHASAAGLKSASVTIEGK